MDEEIGKWIIEYLLRQNIDDRIVSGLIESLPLPKGDIGLGKSLLLRRIAAEVSDGSVSEIMLEALEMVEELEHREGKRTLESMKSAYCAVAVDCTVRFLEEDMKNNDKYISVAKRIWEKQIEKMKKGECGLLSEKLMRWKQNILSAISDSDVRSRLLSINTRKEAVKAVNVYLTEAWRSMGPSFLELVFKRNEVNYGQIVVYNGHADDAQHRTPATPNVDDDIIEGEINLRGDDHANGNEGTQRSQSPARHKNAARHSKLASRRSKLKPIASRPSKHTPIASRPSKLTPIASRKARFTHDGSNSLLEEFHTVQEGSAVEKRPVSSNDQSTRVISSNEQMDADIDQNGDESQKRNEGNATQTQNNTSQASLMERNPTAQTVRWEDSAEDSLGASPIRYKLPEGSLEASPIRYKLPDGTVSVSVVQQSVRQKLQGSKRRKVKKWTQLEEDALKNGVAQFGKGKWKPILNAFPDVFEERTEVDLKDKWRNLTR